MADEQQVNTEETQANTEEKPQQPEAASSGAESTDVDNAKAIGIIGYIIPILFFLPLVMDDLKENSFAKFHANQQLLLLLAGVVGYLISSMLTIVLIGLLLLPLVAIFLLVLAIMGILNVSNGEKKELPLIGGITLIK